MVILALKLAALQLFWYLAAGFLSQFSLQSFFLDVYLWRHTWHFSALLQIAHSGHGRQTNGKINYRKDTYRLQNCFNKIRHLSEIWNPLKNNWQTGDRTFRIISTNEQNRFLLVIVNHWKKLSVFRVEYIIITSL